MFDWIFIVLGIMWWAWMIFGSGSSRLKRVITKQDQKQNQSETNLIPSLIDGGSTTHNMGGHPHHHSSGNDVSDNGGNAHHGGM